MSQAIAKQPGPSLIKNFVVSTSIFRKISAIQIPTFIKVAFCNIALPNMYFDSLMNEESSKSGLLKYNPFAKLLTTIILVKTGLQLFFLGYNQTMIITKKKICLAHQKRKLATIEINKYSLLGLLKILHSFMLGQIFMVT